MALKPLITGRVVLALALFVTTARSTLLESDGTGGEDVAADNNAAVSSQRSSTIPQYTIRPQLGQVSSSGFENSNQVVQQQQAFSSQRTNLVPQPNVQPVQTSQYSTLNMVQPIRDSVFAQGNAGNLHQAQFNLASNVAQQSQAGTFLQGQLGQRSQDAVLPQGQMGQRSQDAIQPQGQLGQRSQDAIHTQDNVAQQHVNQVKASGRDFGNLFNNPPPFGNPSSPFGIPNMIPGNVQAHISYSGGPGTCLPRMMHITVPITCDGCLNQQPDGVFDGLGNCQMQNPGVRYQGNLFPSQNPMAYSSSANVFFKNTGTTFAGSAQYPIPMQAGPNAALVNNRLSPWSQTGGLAMGIRSLDSVEETPDESMSQEA